MLHCWCFHWRNVTHLWHDPHLNPRDKQSKYVNLLAKVTSLSMPPDLPWAFVTQVVPARSLLRELPSVRVPYFIKEETDSEAKWLIIVRVRINSFP